MRNTDSWGIDHSYQDGKGDWHDVPAETKQKLWRAMDADGASGPADPHLMFVQQGDAAVLETEVEVILEDGTTLNAARRLPPDLPLGYHTLTPRQSNHPRRLIVTPKRCFPPPERRIWGWALQLYSLRSAKSWGIGDFADLRDFANWAVDRLGAGVIMTNPLNAAAPGAPQQASPYSPTSRLFRNVLYLRIEDIPGVRGQLPQMGDLFERGDALNREPLINRDQIFSLKMEALGKLWPEVRDRVNLSAYEKEQGAHLDHFATYYALAERHGPSWRNWPAAYCHPANPAVAQFQRDESDRIRFHKWVQFSLEQQFAKVSRQPVIMQDLPIGVDPDGADAWNWQDVFAQNVSVGAPPDIFNTQGQDWGLQPFVPHKLRAAAYEPFIHTVRAEMRHSSALRIDHVMGLFRLFWIPAGEENKSGTYIRYRQHEMLAILALESVRARAFVVGEDLGTVEEGVRETLARKGVLSYRVMWFEKDHPRAYPPGALAAISTHDLPTIAGLWSGADLKEQQQLGLQPNVEGTRESRDVLKKLTGSHESTPVGEVVLRAYAALGEAPSAVVIATLEDALALEQRPNLPGTLNDKRPNWSMPLPETLERIENDPAVKNLATAIAASRSSAPVDPAAGKTKETSAPGLHPIRRGEHMTYPDVVKDPRPGPREEHREGYVARSIEQQTAKLPSDTWLWCAIGSIGVSLYFQFTGDERKANFVGHWAPTFLLLGLYNKLVKLHGSEGV